MRSMSEPPLRGRRFRKATRPDLIRRATEKRVPASASPRHGFAIDGRQHASRLGVQRAGWSRQVGDIAAIENEAAIVDSGLGDVFAGFQSDQEDGRDHCGEGGNEEDAGRQIGRAFDGGRGFGQPLALCGVVNAGGR